MSTTSSSRKRSPGNDKIDNNNNDFDVVIVGSGLTGLTAAYSILKRNVNLDVLILESNDKVGGRILRENNSQAFFGNLNQKHIGGLVEEFGIPMETGSWGDGKCLVFFNKNNPLPEKISNFVSGQIYYFVKLLEVISIDPRYENFRAHRDSEKLAKISIDEFMCKIVFLPQAQSLCRSLLYICCGIENLENVSALWYLVMLHGAGGFLKKLSTSLGDESQFFLKGGFQYLIEELEKRIIEYGGVIKCSESVVKITSNNDRVNVITRFRRFTCDYVIIAVPPPASSRIVVEPALPEFFKQSQNLYESGNNTFFCATYRKSIIPANLSGNIVATLDSGTSLRIIYDATHPTNQQTRVFAGFISKSINAPSIPENCVFRALKKCFQMQKRCCVAYEESIWEIDDSGSPMSVMKPSSIEHHINPMIIPSHRIFLAASEYANNWCGTADGAVEAGEAAARSVILSARPQALDRTQFISYTYSDKKSQPDCYHGIVKTYFMCLSLNVCLFFFLLRDAFENAV